MHDNSGLGLRFERNHPLHVATLAREPRISQVGISLAPSSKSLISDDFLPKCSPFKHHFHFLGGLVWPGFRPSFLCFAFWLFWPYFLATFPAVRFETVPRVRMTTSPPPSQSIVVTGFPVPGLSPESATFRADWRAERGKARSQVSAGRVFSLRANFEVRSALRRTVQ